MVRGLRCRRRRAAALPWLGGVLAEVQQRLSWEVPPVPLPLRLLLVPLLPPPLASQLRCLLSAGWRAPPLLVPRTPVRSPDQQTELRLCCQYLLQTMLLHPAAGED